MPKTLKNDAQRKAFLKDVSAWPVIDCATILGFTFHRLGLPDGSALYAMQYPEYNWLDKAVVTRSRVQLVKSGDDFKGFYTVSETPQYELIAHLKAIGY